MDLVLLQKQQQIRENKRECFNPYFNGSSTSTNKNVIKAIQDIKFQSLF